MIAFNKDKIPKVQLSTGQIASLVHANWEDDNCAVKFNAYLSIDDLTNSTFFHNSRLLLNTLIQLKKENTATVKGNLSRKIVRELFDKIIIGKQEKLVIEKINKVLNEEDILQIHLVRIICELAGIIHIRKRKVLVKEKYTELLKNENAGNLFFLLFYTYFKKFNLGYVDNFSSLDCIQNTISYSLYQLSRIADKPVNIKELKNHLLLPYVVEEIEANRKMRSDFDEHSWLVEARIVKPLEQFGLLKCSYAKEDKYSLRRKTVCKTALFDRFIGFEVLTKL
ncbi:hypothetical protein ACFL3G_11730 [Planctomycetota bacterium]